MARHPFCHLVSAHFIPLLLAYSSGAKDTANSHDRIQALWQTGGNEPLLECVHKLHGATRYCGVPELRTAANRFETALKCEAPDRELLKDQLISAMERLQIWSEQTDWQQLFREQQRQPETT